MKVTDKNKRLKKEIRYGKTSDPRLPLPLSPPRISHPVSGTASVTSRPHEEAKNHCRIFREPPTSMTRGPVACSNCGVELHGVLMLKLQELFDG